MTENYMYGDIYDGRKAKTSEPAQPLITSNFKTLFYGFGDRHDQNEIFGRAVEAISLPTLQFSVRPKDGKLVTDEALWAPTNLTLHDDRANQMIKQVMIQISRQKRDPEEAEFVMVLHLLHPNSASSYRFYRYEGCRITWAAHSRDLEPFDTRDIPFMMQVTSDSIHVFNGAGGLLGLPENPVNAE